MTTLMTRRLGGALLALGLTVAGGAQAAPITFEFTGTVTSSDFSTIPVGSAVTGSYTFDSELADQNPDDNQVGRYRPVDLEIHFVDGSSIITSTAEILILNDGGAPPLDSYSISINAPLTLTGSFAGLTLRTGRLYRDDPTGAAFDDDSLPVTPPDLDSMPTDQSGVSFGAGSVFFTLTSLTLATSDSDDDGIADDADNCPEVANENQSDLDEDGLGDACDPDIDGDEIANDDDNCPFDPNPDQADADGDGAGDACDADLDGDGVNDAADLCLPTATGEVVNTDGCSITQLCPCDNDWKNHDAYVSCVANAADDFVDLGLITGREKGAIVSEAARSQCGKKK